MKLVMKCKATGYPQPYFVWQKENIELKNTSRILIRSDNSLTILDTTREDAGQYECIARNTAGLESASTAVVKVICKYGIKNLIPLDLTLSRSKIYRTQKDKISSTDQSRQYVSFYMAIF